MGMKKIFCFFVILAILMSAMPTSIFAMTSNVTNASGMDETVPGTHEDSNVFSHVKAISLNSSTVSEAPKEEWNKTFGSTGDDEAWAVQQTDDGGYVLAGDTLFESGLCSAWLVKTNSQGEKEWEQTFRGTGFDSACSVQQTIDGGYILAGDTLFETGLCTAWLVKTNSQGDMEWEETFRGTGLDSASSVQQTSDGGYVLAGNTLFESGLCSAWLVKTNSQGDMEWEKTFGITGFDSVSSVQQTTDGGYILAGDTLSSDAGLTAAWLVKTNSKGEKEWDATFGGTGLDSAYSVNQTADGGYILAGETLSFYKGLCTAWLVKTNSKGIKEWEKTYGKTGLDSAYSVQQTTDGGYIFAGETFSLGAYGWTDAWLVKTDSEGNEIGERTFGGSGDDWASAAQQTADGGYVIAGSTDSYGDGDYDAWLIKVGGLSVKKVHNINTREDFATIQEAIDDEDTREGDVIIVDPGTYNENVNVYKSLTIKSTSESPVGTIVLAKDSNDHVFEATADHVTIHGFTVEGATGEQKNGIYLDSVNHCTIANNTVTNNYCGIELTSSSNKNNITYNNITSNNRDGIHLDSSSSNVLSSNIITLNKDDGIHLDSYSSSNVINLNNITFNKFGIYLHSSCNENTIRENNITSNERLGISLATSCNENRILYNEVVDNEENIRIFSSYDNAINNNTVSNGGIGIHLLQNSDNNLVYHNYLQENTCNGLDDGSGNIWDNGYPSGGNYWSDYDEEIEGAIDVKCAPKQNEDGSDGIVDEPYDILGDAGTKDNYPLTHVVSGALSPEAILDTLVEIISYQNEISEYVGDNSDKMFELLIIYATPYPLQNKERKEELGEELIENIPELEIEQQELENFYRFLTSIKEGGKIIFTPHEEGTKVKVENNPEYLVKGVYISFDKITIEKEEFSIRLTVKEDEDAKEFSITLKLFYDDFPLFSDFGIETIHIFNRNSVDVFYNSLAFVETSKISNVNPIVGFNAILTATSDGNTVSITMNDNLGSQREANGKIAVCVGVGLQALIGVAVGAEAFASFPLKKVKEADISKFGEDFYNCFVEKLGENINYVFKSVMWNYAVGSCAYKSTPENAILGVGSGVSLGIGPKIEVEDVKLGIDGKGSVKASIFASKNVWAGIPADKKLVLADFFATLSIFQWKLELLKDTAASPLELLVESGEVSCLFWSLHEQAKELYKDEDTLKDLFFELEGGLGGDIAVVVGGFSPQHSVAVESDLRTLVVPFTLDPSKYYNFIAKDHNCAVSFKKAEDVHVGFVGELETGVSKDLFEIRFTGTESKVSGLVSLLSSTPKNKEITVGDSFSDYGKDIDGNGLYDYLTVEFPLEVNKPGNYTVTGLMYKNSTCISVTKNSSYLPLGTHRLSLDFDGLFFYASRVNGSYSMGYWIVGENNVSVLNTSGVYTTSFYEYKEFKRPKAYLSNYNDSGVAMDGDGLYDFLRVDVEIRASKKQNLIVEGYLEKEGCLVYNSTQADLNPGMTTVFLYFDGKRIRESGLNGSYNLTINIYTLQGLKIDSNEFSTSQYNFTDFQRPNISLTNEYADIANDTDGDELYDYLGINVGVDVKEPGSYTIDAYLTGNKRLFAISCG